MRASFRFITLPTSVGRSILSNWLNAKALGKLDAAYCSRSERANFLNHLSNCETLDADSNFYMLYQNLELRLRWMTKRNVKCVSFRLFGNFNGEVLSAITAFFGNNASKLRNVLIDCDKATIDIMLDLTATNDCKLQTISVIGRTTTARTTAMQEILCNSVDMLTKLRNDCSKSWHTIIGSGLKLSALCVLDVKISCDEDLICICKAAPILREIVLCNPHCSNRGLSTIGEHCILLESLSISVLKGQGPVGIDDGIAAIAKGCRNLHVLLLSNCEQLTDIGMTAVANHCVNLSVLDVSDNRHITDVSLTALAFSQCCGLLTELSLHDCRAITGASLVDIAMRCTQLSNLNLTDMPAEIMTHLPLATLYLKNVHTLKLRLNTVTDEVLQSIGEHMSALKDLDISDCAHSYTSAGLMNIAYQCEKLEFLRANSETEGLSELAVGLWTRLRPGLEIQLS